MIKDVLRKCEEFMQSNRQGGVKSRLPIQADKTAYMRQGKKILEGNTRADLG